VTCLVGVAEAGRVLIAADSCLTLGDSEEVVSPEPKVTLIGPWIVAVCGDWTAVVAARSLDVADADTITTVSETLRAAMAEVGVAPENWDALVGRDGQLWAVNGLGAPMQIGPRVAGTRRNRITRATWAVGNGEDHAKGAMLALDDVPLTRLQRAEAALTIAASCAPGVRPPWRHVEG
jgi:hypothetical protein